MSEKLVPHPPDEGLADAAMQAVNYIIGMVGTRAGLGRADHHMLRHSCYALANKGRDPRLIQDYLGHRDPRHTAHNTRTAAHRFDDLG